MSLQPSCMDLCVQVEQCTQECPVAFLSVCQYKDALDCLILVRLCSTRHGTGLKHHTTEIELFYSNKCKNEFKFLWVLNFHGEKHPIGNRIPKPTWKSQMFNFYYKCNIFLCRKTDVKPQKDESKGSLLTRDTNFRRSNKSRALSLFMFDIKLHFRCIKDNCWKLSSWLR